jgi:hypothetical protein
MNNLPEIFKFKDIIKHLERAQICDIRNYERQRCKLTRVRNHVNFLSKCRDEKLTPRFIQIKNKFKEDKVKRILNTTQSILLNFFLAEARRKMFLLQSKIVKIQAKLFNIVNHDIFEQVEIFISKVTSRVDYKQKTAHRRKWEALLASQAGAANPPAKLPVKVVGDKKLVVNLSNIVLTDIQTTLLSKGLGFAKSPCIIPKFEIIKEIESKTIHLAPEKIVEFKVQIKQAIEKHKMKK